MVTGRIESRSSVKLSGSDPVSFVGISPESASPFVPFLSLFFSSLFALRPAAAALVAVFVEFCVCYCGCGFDLAQI